MVFLRLGQILRGWTNYFRHGASKFGGVGEAGLGCTEASVAAGGIVAAHCVEVGDGESASRDKPTHRCSAASSMKKRPSRGRCSPPTRTV
ncbi:MAG: hypothetical protein GXY65_14965 [Rhodococcus sp.]|nr:hypothetical protein [Rhodococcus sp. (in: high G+C Gram-positive bacteria)]